MTDPQKSRPPRAGSKRPMFVGRRISERWTPRIAREGFTPVASVFLNAYASKELGLNSSEAMLVIILMSFKWGVDDPFPRINRIAGMMGLKERSVRSLLQGLQERGLVRRVRTGKGPQRYDMSGLFETLENHISHNPKETA